MANSLQIFNSPGVYVSEATYGVIPASLAAHNAAYMLGYSPLSTAPKDTPTYVTSVDDFINVFGSNTNSAASIKLFFEQRSGSGLYFVNVSPKPAKTLVIATVTPATVYSITLDGAMYAYTAVTGDTQTTILAALANLINPGSLTASLVDNVLKHSAGATIATSANIAATTVAAPSVPDVHDVVTSIRVAFDADMTQGFICAPEFYQRFTTNAELILLTSALEALASNPDFYWMAIIDCSLAVATSDTLNKAKTERALYTSPKGHSCYYAPYFMVDTVKVPPSAGVIGTALRVMRAEGFVQPPAGKGYPVRGVTGVSTNITRAIQDILNPLGINCIRSFPNNGVVIYGARTLSTSSFYRFYLTRLILNVLSGTLESSFDTLVLSGLIGTTFATIKGTAVTICERLRVAGALYGATPDVSYRVICDETNNVGLDLEAGKVSVDVIVIPAATLEVLNIRLSRAAIGSPLTETVQGTVNTQNVATTPTVSAPGTPNSLSVR